MKPLTQFIRRTALALAFVFTAAPSCSSNAHASGLFQWTRNLNLGWAGDSLGTGNEGTFGAVRIYLPFYNWLVSFYAGPSLNGTPTNTGAPTWHVLSVDGLTIQSIGANMNLLPANMDVIIFEGGTNDITDSLDPNVSNAQLVGAMNDALVDFPNLQLFIYVGTACAGEFYQVVGGVPSFAGNTLLSGTVDAAIETQRTLLLASVAAQTGTNKYGHPVQFIAFDMRVATAFAEMANAPPPPGVTSGVETVDGRHPKLGGIDTVMGNLGAAAIQLNL